MSVSLLTQPQMQSALGLGSGGGGSGVTTLNALNGVINLTSSDTSVAITADAVTNTINLQSAGGGGGGVEGTLYIGTATTVASAVVAGSVLERVINLAVIPLALVPASSYRYQLCLQNFELTQTGDISTPTAQCAFMAYGGGSATQTPISEGTLSALVFTQSALGLLQTQPNQSVEVENSTGGATQQLGLPNNYVTSGVFVASDANFYLQSCWSGIIGDGFNPNLLAFQAGTNIPYQLIISKVNVV